MTKRLRIFMDMIKNVITLIGIMLMVSCSSTETIITPTASRKAIIEGNEVTLITTHKISLSQYNEAKKGYKLLVVK
jgi:hypothetical protein